MAAGLGFKEFTTGDVLTAADANGYLASQVVMVFADAAARTSAITSPQEGMVSFLKDTNETQYYSGAAWVSIGGSSSGLTLVKTQTIGSAVSSVTVTGAFSSTYDNYRIIISGGAGSGSASTGLTLGSTSTGYYLHQIYGSFNSSSVLGGNYSNSTSWVVANQSTNTIFSDILLTSPNLAKNTNIVAHSMDTVTTGNAIRSMGYLADTTQYTAFTITTLAGTLTGGTIRVYGFQNS